MTTANFDGFLCVRTFLDITKLYTVLSRDSWVSC